MIAELDATRWTGRPRYPIRSMVGMALVKSPYALHADLTILARLSCALARARAVPLAA